MERAQKARQVGGWPEVAAVGADVDAGEDDFARAGVGEAAGLRGDCVGRQAAAVPRAEGTMQ